MAIVFGISEEKSDSYRNLRRDPALSEEPIMDSKVSCYTNMDKMDTYVKIFKSKKLLKSKKMQQEQKYCCSLNLSPSFNSSCALKLANAKMPGFTYL